MLKTHAVFLVFVALSCRRRILLSGTPLQNDLEEFYAMVGGDFKMQPSCGLPRGFQLP
jgi:DNA repair and recombination RAD54-like protein